MTKKEITVKIDNEIYDKAKELNIDIETFLNSELPKQFKESPDYIDLSELIQNLKIPVDENEIIKIIQSICRKSKFNYAPRKKIITEARIKGIRKEDVEVTLDKLLKENTIYEKTKMNYKVTKKSP
jgi:DNA replicative helicase MCM subunit Mcm2 (Cdc46/Mcm family)